LLHGRFINLSHTINSLEVIVDAYALGIRALPDIPGEVERKATRGLSITQAGNTSGRAWQMYVVEEI
jgi:hypothetical protein